MENNLSRKTQEKIIERMLIEVMATRENLAKNFFESNLEKKKKKHYLPQFFFDYGSECDE
jgi:hypothetical protein